MTNTTKSAVIFAIATALSLCVTVNEARAQKKSAAASPSAAATASPAAASASPSNAPFEVQMLSYGALDEVLEKLAQYSCGLSPGRGAFSKILVLDSPTLQALQAFDAFYSNAEALQSAFNRMRNVAGAGGSGIDDFADITNAVAAAATASTSETSFSFTIQDPTAAIVLLRHLQAQKSCPGAYYAGVYSVDLTGAKVNGHHLNSIEEELGALAVARTSTLNAIMTSDPGDMKPVPPAAIAKMPCVATRTLATVVTGAVPPATISAVSSTDPCIAAYNNIDGTYNAFLAGLSAANPTTGQPGLSSILQGYRLRGLFGTTSDELPMLGVYLSVAAAGGTQQDRKNLLTALFTGDWIRYSGGVSVNIIVFQIAGENSRILFSDLVRYRTPLEQIRKPDGYRPANAGDNLKSFPSH